jgi:hypothetical protein
MNVDLSKIDRPPLQKGDKRGMQKPGMPQKNIEQSF